MGSNETHRPLPPARGGNPRPLFWPRKAQLTQIASRVRSAWMHWGVGWLGEEASASWAIDANPAWQRPACRDWPWESLTADAQCWICWPQGSASPSVLRAVLAALSPHGQEMPLVAELGPVTAELASIAIADLKDAMRAAVLAAAPAIETKGAPTAGHFLAWSGAVVAAVREPNSEIPLVAVLMDSSCVARLAPLPARAAAQALPALLPLVQACAGGNVQLQAMLGTVDIELRELWSLREGDVIALSSRLDMPLALCASNGAQLGSAYLGRRSSVRAVELAAAPMPATPST